MKKRIISFSFALLLFLVCAIPVFAAETHDARVVDQGQFLTDSEVSELTAKLDEISERQQLEVVVVTTKNLEGKTPMAYADDFYDYNNYGYGANKDGVLLLMSIEGSERNWWISTTGYGITAFTDAGIQYIGAELVPDLKNGNYASAFDTFASEADKFVTKAKSGKPYDKGNLPKKFSAKGLLVALIIGLIVAFIAIKSIQSKYKPVKFKSNASDYLVPGSLQVTGGYENFLYSNVSRSAKSDSSSGGGSSTHSGSSGTSHGGGGGSF